MSTLNATFKNICDMFIEDKVVLKDDFQQICTGYLLYLWSTEQKGHENASELDDWKTIFLVHPYGHTGKQTFAVFTDVSNATDSAGISKHRLSSLLTIITSQNYTAPDSSAGERCFLEVLTVLQWTQSTDSEFQLSITLLPKAYLLILSLNLFLNNFWSWPLLLPATFI